MREELDAYVTNLLDEIERVPVLRLFGRITSVKGLLAECAGLEKVSSIGSRCKITARNGREIIAEVVGFREKTALLMSFTGLEGVGPGCKIELVEEQSVIYPHETWKGRVINAMGEPIDGKGALFKGNLAYPFRNKPPDAHARHRVKEKMDMGVRAINTFLSCCRGQRMGIFAGSGVGKSMLISMLTKYSEADVKIIGLIGERGREVQEFLEDYLGEDGLANAVVVVSTSNESALMRRQASYLTLSIAEYFRDLGKDVLCLIDSITRFAMAQREIGLSAGEPPTSKGYTPTVFTELPQLLERAGPGAGKQGDITGLFSVLVEGDDHNEPISDAVRGILDGHIILDRAIAQRGRYPAINILRSVSRAMPACNNGDENRMIEKARTLLTVYDDMAEMIRLGAYRKGTDPQVDEAMQYFPLIEKFLHQNAEERCSLEEGYNGLAKILAEGGG